MVGVQFLEMLGMRAWGNVGLAICLRLLGCDFWKIFGGAIFGDFWCAMFGDFRCAIFGRFLGAGVT